MPIYEYYCDCGERTEQYRSMDNLELTCSCGRVIRPRPSLFSGKICGNFTVVGHDGRILDKRPYRGRTPMKDFASGREY